MDRYDEAKGYDENRDDKVTHESDTPAREGDVLGLGGSVVPKTPEDPSAADDEESVRRRRERMRAEDDTFVSSDIEGPHPGATGIDMGSGGEGTDIGEE